ncbi:bifunctional lysylphosphatidylglycerol flippase/synthetase MprF [Saccharothrix syringae]|uniref:DUF2156 domain-containing protein n=1 Tax=Saccharothrix syringae TaxID=103733 RepID=A0A5Q0H2I5_SACSY|nr:DUF2156 domain-containing protein [Saccharothrix syringae]QFZ20084.1 DUF2156 domain-containing protein [Saccharothrix syringae]
MIDEVGGTGGPEAPARGGRARRALAAAPVTAAAVALPWALALATRSLPAGPPPEVRRAVAVGVPALADGRWWTPLTAGLWAPGWGGYALAALVALAALPVVERRLGSARTAVLLVVVQVLGSLAGVGLVAALAGVDREWMGALAGQTALGPVGAVVGVVLAGSGHLGPRWRRRLRLLLVAGLVVAALYSGRLADLLALGTGLVGLALSAVPSALPAGGHRAGRHAPSAAEARALVALVVAVGAVGPVVAALTRTPVGPLSVLQALFLPAPPDADTVRALCAAGDDPLGCRRLQARLRVSGLGPAVLTVVPVLLSLAAAEGLRRGRRAAWCSALVLHLLLFGWGVLLAVAVVRTPREERVFFAGTHLWQHHHGHPLAAVLLPPAVPLLVAALLVATRSRFGIGDPRTRRAAARVGLALAAASAVWLVGGWAARGGFDRAAGWGDLLAELPQRFVPPGYLVEIPPALLPATGTTTLLFEWTGALFWLFTTAVLLRLVTTDPGARQAGERERVEALLRRDPRSNLAWMVLWPGHRYWFTPDGGTAVAYRVVGSVALTTGGPFGEPGTDTAAVARFTRFCRDSGWVPCFYAVTEPVRLACAEAGYASVQVAEETVLDLPDLAFNGRRWQDVRTALNHAARAGITAEWHRLATAPRGLVDQVRAISEEWIADKGVPEMGFTLGGLAELADPGTRLLLAVDADRTVHGVTSWLPVHRDGQVVGWTLDFMRRRTDGFRGVVEFLIASAARACRDEGALVLSLSGAPLARHDRGGPATPLQRLLDYLATTLEPVYGFRSLLAFKAKFQPRYLPLHLAYPETAALPAIAQALTRAYLPGASVRQFAALTRRLLG